MPSKAPPSSALIWTELVPLWGLALNCETWACVLGSAFDQPSGTLVGLLNVSKSGFAGCGTGAMPGQPVNGNAVPRFGKSGQATVALPYVPVRYTRPLSSTATPWPAASPEEPPSSVEYSRVEPSGDKTARNC